MSTSCPEAITLWLAGDVMTGRGVDQAMQAHCDPRLIESGGADACTYLQMAEAAHGPIPTPVPAPYVWGEALDEIARRAPQARIANLETAITTRGAPWPAKGVHYRMHPSNTTCLQAARLDCCVLANNHTLDWGHAGLRDTLQALDSAGIARTGAGTDARDAAAPAVLHLRGGQRLLVFAWATPQSGVPDGWEAGPDTPGVNVLDALDERTAQRVAATVAHARQPGDRVVVSLHWGGNWAPEVVPEERCFARRLIDLGAADVVHGHSSHHPRPVEVYRQRLIMYGCGDLLSDYEGIGAEHGIDPSEGCLWFARLAGDGALEALTVVPTQVRRLRIVHADAAGRGRLRWLIEGAARSRGRLIDQPDGSWRLT